MLFSGVSVLCFADSPIRRCAPSHVCVNKCTQVYVKITLGNVVWWFAASVVRELGWISLITCWLPCPFTSLFPFSSQAFSGCFCFTTELHTRYLLWFSGYSLESHEWDNTIFSLPTARSRRPRTASSTYCHASVFVLQSCFHSTGTRPWYILCLVAHKLLETTTTDYIEITGQMTFGPVLLP